MRLDYLDINNIIGYIHGMPRELILPHKPTYHGHEPSHFHNDFESKKELNSLLHPPVIPGVASPIFMFLRKHAVREVKPGSFLVQFEEIKGDIGNTDRDNGMHNGTSPYQHHYVGKILRHSDKEFLRDYTNITEKYLDFKETENKLRRQSHRLLIGIFAFIPFTNDPDGPIAIGPRIPTEQALDPHKNYMLLMNEIPHGRMIDQILSSDLSLLAIFPTVLKRMHRLSDTLTENEALRYAGPDALAQRFWGDLQFLFRAEEVLREIRTSPSPLIDRDSLALIVDRMIHHPYFARIAEREIELGHTKDTLGNVHGSNAAYLPEYDFKPVTRRSQAIIAFDPETKKKYSIQPIVGEAAMWFAYLRGELDEEYQRLVTSSIYQYIRQNKLENDPYGRSMLAMFGMVKLWVRFINDVLADKEYDRAVRFIPYMNRAAQETAEIFPDNQRLNEDRALVAGLMK